MNLISLELKNFFPNEMGITHERLFRNGIDSDVFAINSPFQYVMNKLKLNFHLKLRVEVHAKIRQRKGLMLKNKKIPG